MQPTIEGFRLSPQQRHLWLVQQASPGSEYVARLAVHIVGALDGADLEACLGDLIARHEILRTRFHCLPGVKIPVQVIAAAAEFRLKVSDLTTSPPAEDSERELPLHAELVRLKDGEHVLQILLPALCSDAAGLASLYAEIVRGYAVRLRLEELDGEPLQYADLAEWQNELLEAEEMAAGREHWKSQHLPVRVATDSSADAGSGFASLAVSLDLGDEAVSHLSELAGRLSTGVRELLLACWQVLLWRLAGSGEGGAVVGVAFDGRRHEVLAGTLGLLTRYLPVRCRPRPGDRFPAVMEQVSAAVAEATKWQEYFDFGVNGSGPEGLGTAYPYQFDFVAHPETSTVRGVTFSVLRQEACVDRFEVKLACALAAGRLAAEIQHDARRVTREEIETLAGRLRALVRSLLADPQAAVEDLDILGEAQRRQLLSEAQGTCPGWILEGGAHLLFEEQAERSPAAVALICEGGSLTYGELDARANRLARHLRRLGVGEETLAVVCADRSPEMVVGILAILKAGGAFVPLDPSYPRERLTWMLADSAAPVLLTQSWISPKLPAHTAREVLLDRDAAAWESESAEPLDSRVTAEHPAYVIYTSGSTGRPKGVVVSHRGLRNHLRWVQSVYPLTEADRTLQKTPLSFDVAVRELFWPLIAGARLVLARPGGHQDVGYLIGLIAEHGITVLNFVPSLLQAFLEDPRITSCRSVRRILSGGEALTPELAHRCLERLPVHLHNHYGPTETTITATFWTCTAEPGKAAVPIGRSVANATAHVLDAGLRLVPTGVAGELFVGGAGLARGYLGRFELTAERFLPDPFSAAPGGRLYRTGDLVRRDADGDLRFLGRIDDQVKIRGFRIELGEIEAVLASHPGVSRAVVMVRGEAAGPARLVAYVVASAVPASLDELRHYLEGKLPEYMVPSSWVRLTTLPLTPSGKIDRLALPAPEEVETAGAEPLGPIEEILAGIWSQLLGRSRVRAEDDFFMLGGHSLLATQLISRVRDAFRIEMPLRTVFETSSLGALAARIEAEISAGGLAAQLPPIEPAPRDGSPLPLSFAQQRLWFLHQLEPESPAYNIPAVIRFKGSLKVPALWAVLSEIVRRHEVLRTAFPAVSGKPSQVVLPATVAVLPVVDLRALPPEVRRALESQLTREEARRPFDLQGGPLWRAVLLQADDEEIVVLMTLHHIVTDGWSNTLLVRELVALYTALTAGAVSPLPELPIQYPDFAVWQRRWLEDEALEGELTYWRAQLAGSPNSLELPTDRPRPAVWSYRGAIRSLRLDAALAERVDELGRRLGATQFMTLLAVFQTLLLRYTGQTRVPVGTPVAGRNRSEIEELIGFFVNTLVLSADLAGGPTFSNLLRRVREVALAAHAHQSVPFERLVDALLPERDLSRTPLFQVVLVVQNAPQQTLALPGLQLEVLPVDTATAKFDLTLMVSRAERELVCQLEHNTDLFDASTVQRILGHFSRLLAAAVDDPEAPITELPILTEAERRELLRAWNAGAGEAVGAAPTIRAGFAAQVAQRPDAIAVTCEGESLSYGELDRRANRLAHHLIGLGVRPDDLVGICLEPSLDMVVAILGVLKAGGAYLPLDPTYPSERLAFMLADTGAAVLITDKRLAAALLAHDARVVRLDSDASEIAALSGDEPTRVGVGSGHLAYVIYTSGSTGQPKGVQVTHGDVTRLFAATYGWFGFGPADVWTLFHSYAFDFSVWELWGALLYGGRLVVVPRLVSRSPEAFHRLLCDEGVTVLSQTPSAFRQLLRAEDDRGDAAPPLRWVIFGGEALELQSLRPWFARHGDAVPTLVNMYGITETTVHVTYRPIRLADLETGAGSVIGVPIPDLSVYVLDARQQPLPIGVPGELLVGGAGLARGYLGRPGLTAERFVPDPFSGVPGARLYRSGDLGRFLNDGQLEYLGRIDDQVKIRGFRIELGEIEAALSAHPGIAESVVTAGLAETGERRLIAYVVPRDEVSPAVEDLRAWLQRSLPDYMVPAAFVALPELPLTPNGKIDRRALPEPERTRSGFRTGYVPPRTPAEEVLAGIWSQILGVDQVGVHDNFFALGGDSIRSIQVIALARGRGIEISLPQLFQAQTIAELASLARTGEIGELRHTTPFSLISEQDRRLLPPDLEDAYPLAMLQAGMLYHMDFAPEEAPYHNVDSWWLRAPFDAGLLQEAVDRAVARHPILRTSFHLTGFSEPLQLVHHEAYLPVVVEDLRWLSTEEQERRIDDLLRSEKRRLFDFSRPPQLRFFVQLRSVDTFQLTMTENHAIFDGWSVHSTLGEIFNQYLALLAGAPLPAEPPLALTYRDFIALERQTLESEEAQRYWQSKLRDCILSELPARSTLPPADGGQRFRVVPVEISDAMFERLQLLARDAAVPLKSVLLAVHLKVMSLLAGQPDVVTGVVCNGRPEESEGERLRGLFLNMVPLRVELSAASWRDLVCETFAAEREMLPFRRYPYAVLQRRWGRGALVDVVFNYIHFHVIADLLRSKKLEVLGFKKSEGSSFKLHVVFAQHITGSGLRLSVEYDTWAVAGEQALRIANLYERVLAGISADPARRHDAEPLLPPAERHQVQVEWNDSRQAVHPKGLCELFREQALRRPEAIAVRCGKGALTYAELDRRAGRLARILAARGVGRESVVALLLERGIDFLTVVLAVFEAGGAYLPLDPLAPPARQAQTLAQSGTALVLASSETRASLDLAMSRLGDRQPRACLIADLLVEETGEGELPASRFPHSLAYVIYTSGSTGVPKGAMVEDGGMLNHLQAKIRDLGLTEADAVAQTASQCFDISVWQLLAPLLVGGRVEVLTDEVAHDPLALVRALAAAGITVVESVPSLLRMMLDETGDAVACLSGLRWMISTGEALPPRLCRDWWQRFPGIPLLNAYGPTECSDDVTHCVLRGDFGSEPAHVPVGRPVLNTQIYVLDAGLQPVPTGVAGEIWVGGHGVGRGYLHDPARTAEAFRPDPFDGGPGARLYRTGDLGRHLPGGDIDFLGRIDHQVKIRGFRIEIGEIEAVLGAHPAVAQAVVQARQDTPGDKRLAAYVVPHAGSAPSTEELKAFLRDRLPSHMVPLAVVLLKELPVTANGKVDRKALPAPEAGMEGLTVPSPPRSPVEELVAEIWRDVLAIGRVGSNDDFFDLGGHSLSATQVISRLRRALGIELPLRALFDSPTVAGLAGRLEAELRGGQLPVAPPIEPVPRRGELPLSFAQQRLWILAQLEPEGSAYNLPKAVRLVGSLDVAAFSGALTELVRRHEVLRTTFHSDDEGRPVQVISPSAFVPSPLVDMSGLPVERREAEAELLARSESVRPFDLARGPLLRLALVRLAPEEHLVLFALHHIVSDHWSMAVLVREVSALYAALSRGLLPALPELPVQYADFAAWQRRSIQGEALERELTYWRQRLAAPAPSLHLGGRERPETPTWRGAQHSFRLSQDLTRALHELSRREGATLFMTLLAGLKILLYRRTGLADLVVGTDIANRNRTETEGLIGFFVNLLALRTDLSGGPSVRDALARVREVALGAYAHQDLPFDQLVRALRPERTLSHSPLFDILFVLQNAPEQHLEFPGLTLRPFEIDYGTSRFELSLFLVETPDGIAGSWVYKRDLYDAETIDRLSAQYMALLEAVVHDPEAHLDDLDLQTSAERKERTMEPSHPQKPSFKAFIKAKPRAVSALDTELVRLGMLGDGGAFPLLIEPGVPDVDLGEWAASNVDLLDEKMSRHGALLFRGFPLKSVRDFERVAAAICPQLFGEYGDLPREKQGGSDKVYESTPYPADKTILFHNESSHLHTWPMRQFFFSVIAAEQGGETPIVDCRRIYQRLPPALAERFERLGLLYVRNFTGGLDVSWQEFFHTDDRAVVEAYCRQAGIECEWRGDRLRTRKAALAVATHPKTGEKVFFNQLQLHHVACLDPEIRESMLALFAEEDLPRNVCYGDGSPIEDTVVAQILDLYWQESVSFCWRQGDLLALDNMLVAHARNPYQGPRKIAVAMGRMLRREDLPTAISTGAV